MREATMMFLDCPAYLDNEGAVRCGLPAEVRSRFVMRSTDGPLESAMIRCPVGHVFNAPIEFLTWDKHQGERAQERAVPTVAQPSRSSGHPHENSEPPVA
jgi:hypothetical protein